jgi:hypothetical protein
MPEYEYVCLSCKTVEKATLRRKDSKYCFDNNFMLLFFLFYTITHLFLGIDDESLSASQESLYDDLSMEQDPLALDNKVCKIKLKLLCSE